MNTYTLYSHLGVLFLKKEWMEDDSWLWYRVYHNRFKPIPNNHTSTKAYSYDFKGDPIHNGELPNKTERIKHKSVKAMTFREAMQKLSPENEIEAIHKSNEELVKNLKGGWNNPLTIDYQELYTQFSYFDFIPINFQTLTEENFVSALKHRKELVDGLDRLTQSASLIEDWQDLINEDIIKEITDEFCQKEYELFGDDKVRSDYFKEVIEDIRQVRTLGSTIDFDDWAFNQLGQDGAGAYESDEERHQNERLLSAGLHLIYERISRSRGDILRKELLKKV